jgi:hypothetical protein
MHPSIRTPMISILLLAASTGLAQSSYQVVSVSNSGTIRGAVKWSGPQPHELSFLINKDNEVCDPGAQTKRDLERLVIGPQGGVANTVVYLKNISRGKAMDIPAPRRFLDQKHCQYEPHILLVPQDAALQMKSSDPVLHTVHMDGAASLNLPFPFPAQVVSRTMVAPGLINVRCNGGHVWMNAEIMVVPHPYYAVTDASGKFEISGVPPGEYEIEAWHEGWEMVRQEGGFDVLTQRRVQRPIFSQPSTWDKKVEVSADHTAVVDFTISHN